MTKYIDPRGPLRKITAVEFGARGTEVSTDCNHSYKRNAIFTYTVGAMIRCYECKKENSS